MSESQIRAFRATRRPLYPTDTAEPCMRCARGQALLDYTGVAHGCELNDLPVAVDLAVPSP